MANPPITIGPFTNVPAPGSPIKSDWPQSISTYVDKLPRGFRGSASASSVQTIGATTMTDIAGASVSFTGAAGRMYRIVGFAPRLIKDGTAGLVQFLVRDGAGTLRAENWLNFAAGEQAGLYTETISAVSGAATFKCSLYCFSGTIQTSSTYPFVYVEDIGPTTPL